MELLTKGLICILLKTVVVSEKSVLHIGGFIEVNTTDKGWNSAGIQPAIDLAVKQINNRSDILPNHTIQIHWKDTKCSDAYAIKALIEQLRKPPTKVALLGPGCSISAAPVAAASHFWNLIQMGFSAATPRLSDKTRYPLFFRINAPENILNKAVTSLLRRFKWKRIAIVKQDEDLFNDAHEDLQAILTAEEISIIATNSFVNDPDNIITDLKDKKARIIIGMMYADKSRLIMCAAYRHKLYGPHIQWILPGWYEKDWWRVRDVPGCTTENIVTAAANFLAVEDLVMDSSTNNTLSGVTADEFVKMYKEELKHYPYSSNGYAPLGYDATWVLALALDKTVTQLKEKNKSIDSFSYKDAEFAQDMSKMLLQITTKGITGDISFNKNQERLNKIWIEQFQGDGEVRLGYFVPEKHDLSKGQLTMIPGKGFIWPGGIPPRDEDLINEPLIKVNIKLFYLMSSVAAVGLLTALVFLYINHHYRHHSIIRQSSPRLNNVIVIGCMLAYCCVFVFGAETFVESLDTHSVICKIRWWMFSCAFTLSFGTMFVKTWRVYKIFTNKQLNKQLGSLHDRHLLGIVCGLVGLDVAYLTAWEIINPITSSMRHLNKEISHDGKELTQGQYMICTSANENLWLSFWLIWKSLLLVIGLFLAWETRHVSFRSLNDSKYIGMSVYNVVIMTLITVCLSFVVGEGHLQAKFALFSTSFNVISTFTLLFLFAPKIAKIMGRTTQPEQTPDVVNGINSFNSFVCEQRGLHECPFGK